MTSRNRLLIASVATLVFGLWVGFIAKHHLPLIMFLAHMSILASVAYALRAHLPSAGIPLQLILGSLIGLLASSLSLALVLLFAYAPQEFRARYVSSFYFYPLASLAWLHGAIVFVALRGPGAER